MKFRKTENLAKLNVKHLNYGCTNLKPSTCDKWRGGLRHGEHFKFDAAETILNHFRPHMELAPGAYDHGPEK